MSELVANHELTGTGEMNNPFPGLRPFSVEERDLYFGRENQVGEVIQKLTQNKTVTVVGASGVGKSSFMYCGVLPAVFSSMESVDTGNWKNINVTPGDSPVKILARKLEESFEALEYEATLESLNEGIDGLTNILEDLYVVEKTNFLFLIDQFEEIFRFQTTEEYDKNDAQHYIDLILHAHQSQKVPFYVLINIRADFVGDCAQFPGLTKLINDSQFLIPQMTREEKRKAIVGPIESFDAEIDPALVDEILDNIGSSADQLPIMQHALMRTWNYWMRNKIGNEPITHAHYEAIGGMENALSEHAREAYLELTDDEKKICEKIFKSITEKGDDGRGVRRPAKLQEVIAMVNAPESKVVKVIDAFRKPGRTLLMPAYDTQLNDDSVIDISHESIMRIWVELNLWVEEEAESVKLYLRLAEAAEMHQEGKAGLWRPPDLQIALNWQTEQTPSPAWGLRYHKAYERTMLFLEYSQKEYEREQRIREKMQKRRLILARIVALVLGLGIVVALLFLLYAEHQRREADIQRAEAAKQKEVAEKQANIAKVNEKKALEESQRAEEQRLIAEQETQRALKNERLAQTQMVIADRERRRAIEQTLVADSARKVAMTEEQKAYRLRMLSIAKSMAIKSVQLTDSAKKSLVARQAFNFYHEYGGKKHDPDIYDGMYYALKAMEEPSYNSLLAHTQNVRSIVTSKDSRFVYSAGSDGRIIRWNAENPQQSHDVIAHYPGRINRTLALSKDERYLACAGDFNFIEIYDLRNLKSDPVKVKTNIREIWYLTFTPVKRGLIASGSDKRVIYWDNEKVTDLLSSDSKINDITLSPDGSKLIVAKNNGEVTQVDRSNGNSTKVIYKDRKNIPIITSAYSHNGKFLVFGGEKGEVTIQNTNTGAIVAKLSGHQARVNNITFSHDDKRLATGSFDKTVRLWNMDNLFDPPIVLRDHEDWVWSIQFTPDNNYLLAGCRDHLIRLWPTQTKLMARKLCEKLKRDMTEQEWESYVGEDIPYEETCK
ncbi:High-affnity carbon uptake protein Hat/HatR [Mangrovivirga sp. M17]|uniref:High-affnity carbon uptake protein Hat/HatR n=1 Tax=Mangrovivirga halotolerans TaxID=2993936 RepID=A0ABT3RLK7_9BACT|nr:High-affnity carbon uptake protein Hat/HatR [Mangrovivirga halotolerans]MCX2742685.1 High-affnity carbon uptake protein Hat/HatR [Mangrovivirga halotolerans]